MLGYEEVIDRLGGREKAMKKLGVSRQVLNNWRTRGIPSHRHYELVSRSGGKLRLADLRQPEEA